MTDYIEVMIKKTSSLRMQECRFEFDTDCGNDFQIQHSNNKFIDGLLGGTLDLA